MTPYRQVFFLSIAIFFTGCNSEQKPDDVVGVPNMDNKPVSTLKQLKLDNTETDDAELEKICRTHPELVELTLGGTKVTDAGLVHLAQLPKLKKVRLSKTAITDTGMNALAQCKQLEDIDVSQTVISDGGVKELAELSRLKRLNLYLTFVTDAGLDFFPATIEWLNLDKCPITDEGLAKLVPLSKLAWLHLGGTAITDAGLAGLAQLSSLKEATVTKTETTLEGVEKLRQDRPDMKLRDNVSENTTPEDIEEAREYRTRLNAQGR
ncbi:MAG: hypothetical protein FWC43_06785 [Planctomycetaceae bacterium]|nr:hypothetical protein [Planctomycetaceae bacterium]